MRRSLFLLVGVLLLVSVVGFMAACGEDEEPTATTAAPTETTAAPTETTAAPTETTAAPAGDAKVLRMAVPWPVGDPVTDNIQKNFIDKFNAAQAQYVIELHPAGSLLALPDSFDAVRTGGVEIAGWPTAVFGSIVPEFNLAELPFAVNSIEADAEFNVMMTPIFDAAVTAKHNMKTVYNFSCQGLDIISVEPVKTLADWDGLLCQTISPVTAKVVELLGGAGVAMDFSEGYQALQKKVIEATLQSGSMVIMFKLNEVAKNITRAYLTPASIGAWINLDVYNAMPADAKAAFDKCGQEAQAAINADMVRLYHENYDTMASIGMTVYPLPGAERDKWAEALKPYADELLGQVDAAVADQVRQVTQQLDTQFPYTD
ncbi:MAG: TRAP transporter substrate-binding protein DctP [Thermoleophilia bacterium]|nr:TRAP transporter substrate-binding protein DctP [Thermoleophilia bacterium]